MSLRHVFYTHVHGVIHCFGGAGRRERIGHESLGIASRFAQILPSARDPDSPTSTRFTRLVYQLRLSILSGCYKRQRPKHLHVSVGRMCGHGESNLTGSVPQLARLFRFAHNLAQSGFDSAQRFIS